MPTRRLFFPHGQLFLTAPNHPNLAMFTFVVRRKQIVIRLGRLGILFNRWSDHLCDKTDTLAPAKTFCLHR